MQEEQWAQPQNKLATGHDRYSIYSDLQHTRPANTHLEWHLKALVCSGREKGAALIPRPSFILDNLAECPRRLVQLCRRAAAVDRDIPNKSSAVNRGSVSGSATKHMRAFGKNVPHITTVQATRFPE